MIQPQVLALQKVNNLFTEISNELKTAPYDSELLAPKIAWMRTGARGLQTQFALQLVSNAYAKRPPGEPTPARKVELANFSVDMAELDPDAYFLSELDLEGDVYGIVSENLPAILSRAMLCYDQELAIQIGTNPVTVYDNQTYFVTTALHPYNPMRPALGKFANQFTGVNISRAALTQALDQFNLMLDYDGNVTRKPGVIHIITSTKDQATRARKFIQEGIIASDAGTASESTTLKDEFGEVLTYPELANYYSKKAWLAIKVCSETERPFVVNVAKAPMPYINGLSPNDSTRVIWRGARYGWRAYIGAGFLFPQLAVLFTES